MRGITCKSPLPSSERKRKKNSINMKKNHSEIMISNPSKEASHQFIFLI